MDRVVNQEDASRPSIEPPSSPPPFLAPPVFRRKRTRATDDSTPSSDGPIFSSDPPDPSVDEYFQPRRKRQYRGTWWGETRNGAPAEPAQQRSKSGFTRNMDSGIWMGSDATDEEPGSDASESGLQMPRESAWKHAVPRITMQLSGPDTSESGATRYIPQDEKEALTIEFARSNLQHFLESNNEHINLCHANLKQLPNEFFEPLQTLYRDPSPFHFDNSDGETEEEFQARGLIPRIKMDLSNNALPSLPLSLFHLQNITKLNLSHNNLTQLSQQVGKLESLRTLDISSNRLRWLPWELIQMLRFGKLNAINLDCNPFLQPFSYVSFSGSWEQPWSAPTRGEVVIYRIKDAIKTWRRLKTTGSVQAIEHAEWMTRFYMKYVMQASLTRFDALSEGLLPPLTMHVASTSVTRYKLDGRLMQAQPTYAPSSLPIDEFVFPAKFEEDHLTRILEHLVGEDTTEEGLDLEINAAIIGGTGLAQSHAVLLEQSRVPSLFELALQSATKVFTGEDSKYHMEDLLSMVREDDPDSVRQGVETAIDVHQEGGRICSVCSRSFIIARTEWHDGALPIDERRRAELTIVSSCRWQEDPFKLNVSSGIAAAVIENVASAVEHGSTKPSKPTFEQSILSTMLANFYGKPQNRRQEANKEEWSTMPSEERSSRLVAEKRLDAERKMHSLTKRQLAAIGIREKVRERKIKHLRSLYRQKPKTLQREQAVHALTVQRFRLMEQSHFDLGLKNTILKHKCKTQKKATKNFERLKAAYLSLQKRFQSMIEFGMSIEEERMRLERELMMYDGVTETLKEVREHCGVLEGRLAQVEVKKRCVII
ncbi:hypothetical protein FKW77_001682 [Venturia effusa]|uniref:Uncharacterized protein n=1 Tax=Venturia effusa TaxID=50376 RepID=A0A517LAF8_9PEZI|nr:hypothetical protein FKW77_001682 [Venturia effusa]